MNVKQLLETAKTKFSFMTPISWMGVGAFGFGFFVGSEGDLAGAAFFSAFWTVGIFITTQFLNMSKK